MRKTKNWNLWFIAFSVLMVTTFSISCLHAQSTPNSTLPTTSTETSASPTTNTELPPILTYGDLNRLVNADPAKIDNSRFPITPAKALHVTVAAPPVDITKYKLTVDGLVNNPLSLSYDAILKYPTVSQVVLLICPGVFVDNAEWTGVPVTTLLSEADVKPEATQVTIHAMDGFEFTFSLQDVQQDGVFLAHTVNGQVLPADHGYPIRLVLKGQDGGRWLKWVDRLEIK